MFHFLVIRHGGKTAGIYKNEGKHFIQVGIKNGRKWRLSYDIVKVEQWRCDVGARVSGA